MPTLRKNLVLLLSILPLATIMVGGWARRWIGDDGMINLRTVQMLLDGWGPVFNVGERVESFTSALWVYLITALSLTGVSAESIAVALGFAFTALGVVSAQRAAMMLHGAEYKWRAGDFVPMGILGYVALPVAWDYTTSGLETSMSLGWLGLSYMLLIGLLHPELQPTNQERFPLRQNALVAFVLGLGPVIRPELALFGGLGLMLQSAWMGTREGLTKGQKVKHFVLMVFIAGLIPVGYQLFRMGYYAAIVPNTAIAKEAFDSRWDQGLRFFDNFFGRYHLLMPLGISMTLGANSLSRVIRRKQHMLLLLWLLPLVCGIFYCVYIMKVGGGFMHGRLFLPGVFCLIMPVAMVPWSPHSDENGRQLSPIALGGLGLALFWFLLCVCFFRVERENEFGIGDERGWYARISKMGNPITPKDYEPTYFYQDAMALRKKAIAQACGGSEKNLANRTCASPLVILDSRHHGVHHKSKKMPLALKPLPSSPVTQGDALMAHRVAIGISGMVLGPGVHLFDSVGLSDPVAARFILLKRGRPGHEKMQQNDWFLARTTPPNPEDTPRIAKARQVLNCPPVQALYHAVYDPLTWGRFWQNVAQAYPLHKLRIHPDPNKAFDQLCPKGS